MLRIGLIFLILFFSLQAVPPQTMHRIGNAELEFLTFDQVVSKQH